MLLDLEDLHRKLTLKVTGIVHVGAHLGEEHTLYRQLFPGRDITWIEADPVVFEQLATAMQHEPGVRCVNAVVSETRETVRFHRASNQQSSSFLPLGTHKTVHPEVVYVDSFSAKTETLDDIASTHRLGQSNFLVMDVQGAEGKVIAGGRQFLRCVDYIYSEVNRDELYLGCTVLEAFDAMLDELGFDRVELSLNEKLGWGDAFYVRRAPPHRLNAWANRLARRFARSRLGAPRGGG